MSAVTDPALQIEDNSSPRHSIQCQSCLNEIIYSDSDQSVIDKNFASCSRCGYKQPIKSMPTGRDMAIFGSVIASVYFATIVFVLIIR